MSKYESTYFDDSEIVCRCCGEGVGIVSDILLERLDALRGMYGHPIYCSCVYRCPSHNYEVGGVWNSQHVIGTAADIYVDGDYEEFYQLVINSQLFDGVGHYSIEEFVHVDVRDDGESPNYYLWEG